MSRPAGIVTAVTAVSGVVLVAAAAVTATGWETGGWPELVLVVAAVVFVSAVGVIVVTFVITAAMKAAGLLVIAEHPPALDRISSVMEQWEMERDAVAAERSHRPVPPRRAARDVRVGQSDADSRRDDQGFAAAVIATDATRAPVPSRR